MPLPLLGLLPIVASLAPDIVKWIGGDKAGAFAGKVADVVKGVVGTDDVDAVEKAIAADPNLALQLKIALLKAGGEEDQRRHDETMAAMADVADARRQTVQLAQAGSAIAWGAPIITSVVLVTFGIMLWVVLTRQVPTSSEQMALLLLGALTSMAVNSVAYWVGSSSSSAKKDTIFANQLGKK